MYEKKLNDQQINYQNNIKQCGNDYEKQIQLLKQEIQEYHNKYNLSIQQNEQLQQEKNQIRSDFENQQEIDKKIHENEKQLFEKLKLEYEQVNQQFVSIEFRDIKLKILFSGMKKNYVKISIKKLKK